MVVFSCVMRWVWVFSLPLDEGRKNLSVGGAGRRPVFRAGEGSFLQDEPNLFFDGHIAEELIESDAAHDEVIVGAWPAFGLGEEMLNTAIM
jgi:hypothetical protein